MMGFGKLGLLRHFVLNELLYFRMGDMVKQISESGIGSGTHKSPLEIEHDKGCEEEAQKILDYINLLEGK